MFLDTDNLEYISEGKEEGGYSHSQVITWGGSGQRNEPGLQQRESPACGLRQQEPGQNLRNSHVLETAPPDLAKPSLQSGRQKEEDLSFWRLIDGEEGEGGSR